MARSIAEIKKQITDVFISYESIRLRYDLQAGKTFDEQFSSVSLENIIFYCVAACIWTLDKLFDLHTQEIDNTLADKRPHTTRWYANIAKQFQYGFNLLPDSEQYDNTGKTDEQIQASKIVTYSAVDKGDKKLIIKVAKNNGDNLAPLTISELAAFGEYMSRVQDAGDNLEIISHEADKLKLNIDIYYNPLVLNADGERLDKENMTPIADAIRQYLKILPFNGELVLTYLVDALQKVEGVVIPDLILAEYRYAGTDWLPVSVKYKPLSGYFTITDEDLKIRYIAQSEIL